MGKGRPSVPKWNLGRCFCDEHSRVNALGVLPNALGQTAGYLGESPRPCNPERISTVAYTIPAPTSLGQIVDTTPACQREIILHKNPHFRYKIERKGSSPLHIGADLWLHHSFLRCVGSYPTNTRAQDRLRPLKAGFRSIRCTYTNERSNLHRLLFAKILILYGVF